MHLYYDVNVCFFAICVCLCVRCERETENKWLGMVLKTATASRSKSILKGKQLRSDLFACRFNSHSNEQNKKKLNANKDILHILR